MAGGKLTAAPHGPAAHLAHTLTSPEAGGKLVAARPAGGRLTGGCLEWCENSCVDLWVKSPNWTRLQAALLPVRPSCPQPGPVLSAAPGPPHEGAGAGPEGTTQGSQHGQECADPCLVPGTPFPSPLTVPRVFRGEQPSPHLDVTALTP